MPTSIGGWRSAPETFQLVQGNSVLVGVEAFPCPLAQCCLEAWVQGEPDLEILLGSDKIAKLEQRRPMHRLARGFLGLRSRSRRAFELGLSLQAAGVRVATPLAYLEKRRLGVVLGNAIILERVAGSTLRDFILSRVATTPPGQGDELKRRLWQAVATEIARLHAAQTRQRDLKAPNVIVKERSRGEILVTLIDLEGMACLGAEPCLGIRARDLSRLAASLREPLIIATGVTSKDWSTLLGEYLAAWKRRPPEASELQTLLDLTNEWAKRKVRRNEQSGRVTW